MTRSYSFKNTFHLIRIELNIEREEEWCYFRIIDNSVRLMRAITQINSQK